MIDSIDKKIVECLKKGENSQTGIFREVFSREGQRVFSRRLQTLQSKGLINIKKNRRIGYTIKLNGNK